MTGHPPELFADQKWANLLVCWQCDKVYRNPVVLPCARRHVFCRGCLAYMDVSGVTVCRRPTCAEAVATASIEVDEHTAKLVDDLRRRCLHFADGCTWEGTDFFAHQSQDCGFEEVSCPAGCSITILRRDAEDHVADECPEGLIPCPHGGVECSPLPRRELSEHEKLCRHVKELCPDGCGASVVRSRIIEHGVDDCPEVEVECPRGDTCPKMKRREAPAHDAVCEYHLCKWKKCDYMGTIAEVEQHEDRYCNPLQKELKSLREEIDDIRASQDDQGDELEELKAENEQLKEDLEGALAEDGRISTVMAEKDALRTENDRLEGRIAELKRDLKAAERKLRLAEGGDAVPSSQPGSAAKRAGDDEQRITRRSPTKRRRAEEAEEMEVVMDPIPPTPARAATPTPRYSRRLRKSVGSAAPAG